jgi:hypothetical protein
VCLRGIRSVGHVRSVDELRGLRPSRGRTARQCCTTEAGPATGWCGAVDEGPLLLSGSMPRRVTRLEGRRALWASNAVIDSTRPAKAEARCSNDYGRSSDDAGSSPRPPQPPGRVTRPLRMGSRPTPGTRLRPTGEAPPLLMKPGRLLRVYGGIGHVTTAHRRLGATPGGISTTVRWSAVRPAPHGGGVPRKNCQRTIRGPVVGPPPVVGGVPRRNCRLLTRRRRLPLRPTVGSPSVKDRAPRGVNRLRRNRLLGSGRSHLAMAWGRTSPRLAIGLALKATRESGPDPVRKPEPEARRHQVDLIPIPTTCRLERRIHRGTTRGQGPAQAGIVRSRIVRRQRPLPGKPSSWPRRRPKERRPGQCCVRSRNAAEPGRVEESPERR